MSKKKNKQWKVDNVSTNFDLLKSFIVGKTISDALQTDGDNSLLIEFSDGTKVELQECGDDMSSIQYYIGRME